MKDILSTLQSTSLPAILVVGGLVFLFLGIVGQVRGQIWVPANRQRLAAILGGILLTVGMALYLVPVPSELQSSGGIAAGTPSLVPNIANPTVEPTKVASGNSTPREPAATPLIPTSIPTSTPRPAIYDWVNRNPFHSPSDRGNFGLAFDSRRNVFVLFGGSSSWTGRLSDTWEWNGRDWTQIPISGGPSPRDLPAMVFDVRRGVIVLFGGRENISGQGHSLNDIWEYDGTFWRNKKFPVSPSPRDGGCVAYDEARGLFVLFGGVDEGSSGSIYNDTWTYDGVTWNQRKPTRTPQLRSSCSMTYDSVRSTLVMFGGAVGTKTLDDTWEWNGTDWLERTSLTRPPARAGHALVYNSNLKKSLLFGGDWGACSLLYEDTWAWDGFVWQPLVTSSPGTHSVISSAYNPLSDSILLFGGWSGGRGNCGLTSGTWEYVRVDLK